MMDEIDDANRKRSTALLWTNSDGAVSTLNVLIPWEPYCKDAFKVFDLAGKEE